jgi:hypothetical protein
MSNVKFKEEYDHMQELGVKIVFRVSCVVFLQIFEGAFDVYVYVVSKDLIWVTSNELESMQKEV